MRARRIAMSAALTGIIGGCAPMAERGDFPPRAPIRMVGGTATPSIALEREVRYYVDEQGAIWDDTGRKQQRPPLAAATVRP